MKIVYGFTEKDYDFLLKLKDKSIQHQYYLKHEVLDDLPEVKRFVMRCQSIGEDLDITKLRVKIEKQKN